MVNLKKEMKLSKVTSIKYKSKEILSSESKKIQHAGIFYRGTSRPRLEV